MNGHQMIKHISGFVFVLTLSLTSAAAQQPSEQAPTWPAPQEADFTIHDFHFQSGETLPEVRMHYTTLGKSIKDASGHTTNAVLVLHGTGGSCNRGV